MSTNRLREYGKRKPPFENSSAFWWVRAQETAVSALPLFEEDRLLDVARISGHWKEKELEETKMSQG